MGWGAGDEELVSGFFYELAKNPNLKTKSGGGGGEGGGGGGLERRGVLTKYPNLKKWGGGLGAGVNEFFLSN